MKIRNLIYIIFLFFGLLGCSKEFTEPSIKGELLGFVELVDVNGEEYLDLDSIKVSIDESDYSSTTDINGRFFIKGFKPGTYNIIFQNDSFGVRKIFNIPVIGGEEPYFFKSKITIYEQPKSKVKFASVENVNNTIKVDLVLDTIVRGDYTLYWSDSPEITPNNYIQRSSLYTGYYTGGNSISGYLSLSDATRPLFEADNIYFIATVKNSYEKIGTYNYVTEKSEYYSEVSILKPMKVE